MPTTTQKFFEGMCQSLLIVCCGTNTLASADDPLQTITVKDRSGRVEAKYDTTASTCTFAYIYRESFLSGLSIVQQQNSDQCQADRPDVRSNLRILLLW
jgi:hypothetical protein